MSSPDGPESPEQAGRPGAHGATRTYDGPDGMRVDWDASRCLHVAACIRTAPEAFDPQRRPWVQLGEAPADRVAAAVRACPTGALRLQDDSAPAPAAGVTVRPKGPYFLAGQVEVVGQDGQVLDTGSRVALCRCGATGNPPYCDGSHTAVGFDPAPPVRRDGDPAPESAAVRVQVTDGPYVVTGAPVTAPGGEVLHPGAKCSLCRCGRSGSKPFCDGSHARS